MRPRLASASLVICVTAVGLAACGGRQHQHLGTGRMQVAGAATAAAPGVVAPGPAGAAAAAAPTSIALPPQSPSGRYRVRYQIWLPRAMEVSWTLRCADHEEHGVAGETFARYRVRRTAELVAERQRERDRRAQVGSLVGGVLLGQAQASGTVATPNSAAQATVTLDGGAAGAAIGAATVTDAPIVLAPDDLGQGYRQGEARFWLGDLAGSCAIELTAVDADEDASQIAGSFSVERWFDGKRAERQRVATGAGSVRADLRAGLVTRGADPTLQQQRRAAEQARLRDERAATEARAAQQRAAAELALRAEAEVQMSLEVHVRTEVWQTREALYVYLGTCGGNRHRREELRAAEEHRRLAIHAEAQARVRIALDIRTRLRGGLITVGADPELAARLRAQAEADARRRAALAEAGAAASLAAFEAAQAEAARRDDLAAGARGDLVDSLIATGARLRPPMPAAVDEVAGAPPSSAAQWTAGYWTWNGAQWAWIEGRWFGGAAIITVDVGGSSARAPTRDHREQSASPSERPAPPPPKADPAPPRPRTRDHR